MLDDATICKLPKTLLHDHLDGGLRPATIVELADAADFELPTRDPEELGDWFHRGARRGSLPLYLEGFWVTCGVMQTEAALRRVARERVEDLIADGVVYAELRFAPFLHTERGLSLDEVMDAVFDGLREGSDDGRRCVVRMLICGLRNLEPKSSLEMAALAVRFRERGVVGFDLAGDEAGHPPKKHLEAFQYLRRANFNITIHAGEGFGLSSIWQALQYCGAHRIGHGTRLYEDLEEGSPSEGTLADYVRDHRILLEMCLSSNVHTAAVESFAAHPFQKYFQAGFRCTLNTDNTLMSATTLSQEWQIARDHYGLGLADFERLAVDGVLGSFLPYAERRALIDERIRPAYQASPPT
ncbi:MAG: adenosine deaminase [Myxococcota bacterium]